MTTRYSYFEWCRCGHATQAHTPVWIASGNAGDAYALGPCALMCCDCREWSP